MIVRVPLARLTTSGGAVGFGQCHTTREHAAALLGQPLDTLFASEGNAVAEPPHT